MVPRASGYGDAVSMDSLRLLGWCERPLRRRLLGSSDIVGGCGGLSRGATPGSRLLVAAVVAVAVVAAAIVAVAVIAVAVVTGGGATGAVAVTAAAAMAATGAVAATVPAAAVTAV